MIILSARTKTKVGTNTCSLLCKISKHQNIVGIVYFFPPSKTLRTQFDIERWLKINKSSKRIVCCIDNFWKTPRMKTEKTFNIGKISKTKGNIHLKKSQASDLNYLGVRRLFPQYRLGIKNFTPIPFYWNIKRSLMRNFHQIIQRQSVPV